MYMKWNSGKFEYTRMKKKERRANQLFKNYKGEIFL